MRAVRAYVIFVVVSLLLTVSVGYLAAGRAVHRTAKAWADAFEPMGSFVARYPKQPDSPAGRKLDELTRPLGIEMCGPRGATSGGAKGPHDDLFQELGTHIGNCERAGSDECAPPSNQAQLFLERERARLDATETQILEGGPLRWEQDVSKGVAAPIPRLLGHRWLQNLLLTRALMHSGQGRLDAAERTLEASWILNASMTERPDLLSRLIAVAVTEMQHGVLRTMKAPSERWPPRMRQSVLDSDVRVPYQLEAWNWTRFTEASWGIFDVDYMESGEPPPRTLARATGQLLTAPYVRLSIAGMSEALLRASQELGPQRRCDLDLERYAKEFEESFPRWNILGRIATPSVVRTWASLRYANLDRELTAHVLAARGERRATGQWPSASLPSSTCEGVIWRQQPAGDGTFTIRASEKPFAAQDLNWRWSVHLHP